MDIRWFHGLAAYNKAGKGSKYCPIETMRRAQVVNGGAELACSDKPIGEFGVVVSGTTKVVFERDCWSRVYKGVRYTDANLYNWTPDGTDSDEEYAHQWCAEQENRYCEAFVKECTIIAVWCKTDASDARYWQAKSLALKLKVQFLEIAKETTIGIFCGTTHEIFE